MIDIFDISNERILSVMEAKEAVCEKELMRSWFVRLSWSSEDFVRLEPGSYIIYEGVKYRLLEPYVPTQKDELQYDYKPEFQHPIMQLSKKPYYFADGTTLGEEEEGQKRTTFTITGNLVTMARHIGYSVNALEDSEIGTGWEVEVIGDVDASIQSITFDGIDVLTACDNICSTFGCEYFFDYAAKKIYFGVISLGSQPAVLTEGENVNIASPSSNSEEYFNSWLVLGSTKNIVRELTEGDFIQYGERLTLDEEDYPGSIIDTRSDKHEPLLTGIMILEDVYPTFVLYLYDVRERSKIMLDDNGNVVTLTDGVTPKRYSEWYFQLIYKDSHGDWQKFYLDGGTSGTDKRIVDKVPHIIFQENDATGAMATPLVTKDFEVEYYGKDKTYPLTFKDNNEKVGDTGITLEEQGFFKIKYVDDNGTILPGISATGLTPRGVFEEVGGELEPVMSELANKIAVYNIVPDEDSLDSARYELLQQALSNIAKKSADSRSYTTKSNPVVFVGNEVSVGSKIEYHFLNGSVLNTRVLKITKSLEYAFEQEITFGNNQAKGLRTQLKEEVSKNTDNLALLASYNEMIDALLQSLNRAQQTILSGLSDNYWEEYTDPQTGNVSVKLKSQYAGAWAEGFLSGLGYWPGGGGGGVTLNNVLDGINNTTFPSATPSSAGQAIVWDGTKWTFGTAGGGGTDLNAVWDSLGSVDDAKQIDLSHLTTALAGYATQSWVSSNFNNYVHPTNGANKTISDGNGKVLCAITVNNLGHVTSVSGKTLSANDIPSLAASKITSGTFDAARIPSLSWNKITSDKPTTLSGYGITDAKIQNGTITLGSNTITPVTSLSGYATQTWVQQTALSGYATESWVTGTALSGYATQTWVTDNMMKKARLDTTANIDTLYDAGSYRFGATAEGTWPVASNYGQVLVVRGADDTVAQMFFPYVESKVYLRTGNPIKQNNGSWHAWKELATTDGNIATATRLASNDTKTLFGITYWSGGQPQNVGTSWSNTAHISYISNITMKGGLNGVTTIEMNNNGNGYLQGFGGVIDFHYNASTDDYTSRIIEDQNGRLNFNGTAFLYKSNKPGSASDFPGGALNETTDWGGYSFRNVFTNNSLFENSLFLRADLFMKTNTGIRIKNYAGANVMALSLESNSSNNSIVVGAGAHTVAGVSTYIRGNTVNFQTANGAGSTAVGHFSNSGDFYIDAAGKSLYMNDGTTTRSMMGINIPATLFHLCYGAVGADWQTRIYGGGSDNKGIAFFHGTTLAASVEGGDHSFVAYNHIKLTTNNQSLYTRNTNNTPIDTVRMGSNNILNFGYGCSTQNHETRLYGGATAGIGLYCGTTEVARVHKDAARQGIRIGDALLSWDSTNNALKVQRYDGTAVNLYSLGGLSGLGFTAPQSSLEAFRIDYLTSTSMSTQTIDVATKINLGSSNCYIQANSNGSLTINASSGLTLGSSGVVADPTGGLRASRFYLNSSTWIYFEGSSLKISNGTTTKTIITL